MTIFDHYDAHGLPTTCDKAEAELRDLRADEARWEETVGELNEKVIAGIKEIERLGRERDEARRDLAKATEAIAAAGAYIDGRNELSNQTHAAVLRLNADLTAVRNMLADCVVKATEYGDQDGGFVAMYILPTGPIHRAIPYLDGVGINVRPGFDGRKALAADAPAALCVCDLPVGAPCPAHPDTPAASEPDTCVNGCDKPVADWGVCRDCIGDLLDPPATSEPEVSDG